METWARGLDWHSWRVGEPQNIHQALVLILSEWRDLEKSFLNFNLFLFLGNLRSRKCKFVTVNQRYLKPFPLKKNHSLMKQIGMFMPMLFFFFCKKSHKRKVILKEGASIKINQGKSTYRRMHFWRYLSNYVPMYQHSYLESNSQKEMVWKFIKSHMI